MNLFRKKKGAISVFLVIILVPVIVVASVFVDVSRVKLSRMVVDSAADLTLNTVLTRYDQDLNDFYGIMASSQSVDEFLETAEDYFRVCITSQGIDTTNASRYASEIKNLFFESGDISDLLNMEIAEDPGFKINKVKDGSLVNPALVKKSLVEFMKYRSPINKAVDLLNTLKKNSKALEDSIDDTELTEKKRDYYEQKQKVMEILLEIYKLLLEYEELEITQKTMEDFRDRLTNSKENYRKIHEKILRDLINTQGYVKFQPIQIEFEPEVNNPYDGEKRQAGKTKIRKLTDQTYKRIKDYLGAKYKLNVDVKSMPYSNNVYDIQYWIHMVNKIYGTASYKKFADASNNMFESFQKLENAYENAKEDATGEEYSIDRYYEAKGSPGYESVRDKCSLDWYFNDIADQIWNYKKFIKNKDALYWELSGRLERISNIAIDSGAVNPQETEKDIIDIYTKISGFYQKIEKADDIITNIVGKLKKLKDEVNILESRMKEWKNKAESMDTDLSKSDIKEINGDKNENGEEKFLIKVSVSKVDLFKNRLNNIKSLLGEYKKETDAYQYNGTPVRTLSSYQKVVNASGIEKNKISYLENEIVSYIKDTFTFSVSERLVHVGITTNNNPSFDVNPPELYTEIKEKFKDYNEDDAKEKEDEYEDAKKQEKEEIEKAELEGDNNGVGDIKADISDRPSEDYKEMEKQNQSEIKNPLKQISGFISGLFGNLSNTLLQAGVDIRDDLYITDYIMSMFSYETFEKEGKYNLLSDGEKKGISLDNYKSTYKKKEEEWKSTEVEFSENKTLTNKMINEENNFAFLNEVEYILYGGNNKENKKEIGVTLFLIRYAMNLPADMDKFWKDPLLIKAANAVTLATKGIIPAPLFKLVYILGLTAAESAKDLSYLKAGIPVKFLKTKNDLFIDDIDFVARNIGEIGSLNYQKGVFLQYSDYLSILLFAKMLISNSANNVYARTMDVVQANMSRKILNDESYLLRNAQLYYKLNVNIKTKPLMLELPFAKEMEGNPYQSENWYTNKYSYIRGY